MELLKQHQAPESFEFGRRIACAGTDRSGGAPQFRFPQQMLAAPVAALGIGLAGVGAAVEFKVHFPHPDGEVRIVRLGAGEEVRGRAEPHLGGSFQVRGAARRCQHFTGGAAAAVAITEREQGHAAAAVVPVVALGVREVPAADFGTVAVHRREMREEPGAVNPLPAEGVVRHPVDLVPGDLLGQEPAAAGRLDDLRQRGGVAEGVRQPRFPAFDAELRQEEAFALQELPRHRFAAGHVAVRFDPHAAHRDELSGPDLFPDPAVQLRVVFLDPGELLRRGAGKHEPGVLVHERNDVGERPCALPDGFPDGPQPGGVDVCVAGGNQLVGRGVGRPGQHLGERRPARGGRARDVVRVHHIQHPFQRPQDLMPAGQLHREFVHESAERSDVLLQFPDGPVQLGDDDRAQTVLCLGAGRGLVPVGGGRERPALREVRIGGRFYVEVHRHAAAQQLQGNVLVPRGECLDDGSVGPPGRALALEAGKIGAEAQVHQNFDGGILRAPPGTGDLALEPQPFGAPGPAPRRAGLLRSEFLPQRLLYGDRLARRIPAAQCERSRARVHRGEDAFAQKAVQPDFRETAVVVQCDPLCAGADEATSGPSRWSSRWIKIYVGCRGYAKALIRSLPERTRGCGRRRRSGRFPG